VLKLPESLRQELKKPLGELIKDESSLRRIIDTERPKMLISVGDAVSAQLIRMGVDLDLIVVDLRVMRAPASEEIVRLIENWKAEVVGVENPAGTLSEELMERMNELKGRMKIVVAGEEDLAVIPAVLNAPIGSLVVYGQPREGVVVVRVTAETKDKFLRILQKFEKVEK